MGGRHDLYLTGYRLSVYTWVVRIALAEAGTPYGYAEANPFEAAGQEILRASTPFGRVPVLWHGGVTLYETAAILDYVDAMFGDHSMTPPEPLARARMRQVIGIVDHHGYWPLVRQVFSQAVFAPMTGEVANPAEIARGLEAAQPVLAALDGIAAEGLVLGQTTMTLADCHLAPMIDYFAQAEVGREMLSGCAALQDWFAWARARPAVCGTRTDLAAGTVGERA